MICGSLLFVFLLFICMLSVVASQNSSNHFGYFWHLTDPHINISYSSPECTGSLGSYLCDSPTFLWVSALKSTKQFLPQLPDFVIFSGDSVSHGVSEQFFRPSMLAVADALRESFPSSTIPLIPVIGNHDVYPDNLMNVVESPPLNHPWCNELATDPRLWMAWVQPEIGQSDNTSSNPSTFSKGCFYSKLLTIKTGEGDPPSKLLRIISLNGLLWYRWNRLANESISDPFGQFTWLNSTLADARKNGESVLLVMHFPVGATENSPEKYQHLFDNYNEMLVDILTFYSDILIAGLFAHQHTDSFRVLKSNSDPILPLYLLPSISPMRLGGLGSFNPRMRLFKFQRSSLKIINYQQYFLNLSEPTPIWRMEYSAVDEYQLVDLSPYSLSALLHSFVVEDSNWTKYWSHQLGGQIHESGSCPSINSRQRCTHLCAMNHISLIHLRKCLSFCESNSSLFLQNNQYISTVQTVGESWGTLPIVILVILAFVLILIGIVFCVNRELCRKRLSIQTDQNRLQFDHKLSAVSNTYANIIASANARAASSHSRNSSLDGMVEMNTTGDERSLIASNREMSSNSGLGRLSGFVRFSRCNNNHDSNSADDFFPNSSSREILASYKFPSYGGLPASLTKQGRVESNDEISSSIPLGSIDNRLLNIDSFLIHDINDCRTVDLESEESAYDAEVEDDDDENSIQLIYSKPNIPFKTFMSGLPSKLGSRCLLNGSKIRKSENQLDASDNEYYSIHSSLQCLHPIIHKENLALTPDNLIIETSLHQFENGVDEISNGHPSTPTIPKCSSKSEVTSASSQSSISIPVNIIMNNNHTLHRSEKTSLQPRNSDFIDSTILGNC